MMAMLLQEKIHRITDSAAEAMFVSDRTVTKVAQTIEAWVQTSAGTFSLSVRALNLIFSIKNEV